jgi:thioredoxin-related protein
MKIETVINSTKARYGRTLLITLLSVIISLTSCGQSKLDCDKSLDKVPYFARHGVNSEHTDSIETDFKVLKECGQLDSTDCGLLTGPMLGSILVEQAVKGKEVTYRSVLKSTSEFKQTDHYKNFRDAKLLESKVVNLSNWESDRQLLMKAGMTESETENLKEFVKMHSGEKMTFKQAYIGYMASQPKESTQEKTKLKFADLGDLDNAIRSGKENKKAILIYFTCNACANARKMEDNILTNEQVQSLLTSHFVYFSAYVDDKTPDAQTNQTIGNKYMKLQSEKFKNNYQPNFVIIDEKGNVLASLGYTNSTDEFIEFLKRGIK